MEYNSNIATLNENAVLMKYNIFVSIERNIYTLTVLAFGLIAFSNSTFFEDCKIKPYITAIGLGILIYSNLYGWNNVIDYEKYINNKNINNKTILLNENSIKKHIILIKSFLILMMILIILSLINIYILNRTSIF